MPKILQMIELHTTDWKVCLKKSSSNSNIGAHVVVDHNHNHNHNHKDDTNAHIIDIEGYTVNSIVISKLVNAINFCQGLNLLSDEKYKVHFKIRDFC